MRTSPQVLVAAWIVLGGASAAWAGHPQTRQGFWIGFGGGYGSADVSCNDCESGDREGAFVGHFRLGGTLNPHLLLGVESNVWIKEEDDVTVTLGSATGSVTVYPQAESGFFLKAGVGLSYVATDVRFDSATVSIEKAGWGILAGLGYDFRVGRNLSLTPCVNYFYGKPGNIVLEGETAFGGWKQNVVSFELGFTFH
jgi:hypothetical protein